MTSSAHTSLKILTLNYKEDNSMKLVGKKDKGYKLVSSFEKPAKEPKDDKETKNDKGSKDSDNK